MRLLAVLLVVSLAVHLGLLAVPLSEKKLEKKEVFKDFRDAKRCENQTEEELT